MASEGPSLLFVGVYLLTLFFMPKFAKLKMLPSENLKKRETTMTTSVTEFGIIETIIISESGVTLLYCFS